MSKQSTKVVESHIRKIEASLDCLNDLYARQILSSDEYTKVYLILSECYEYYIELLGEV